MNDYGRLRFVIQIAGIYLVVESIISVATGISKYVGYQILAGYPADIRAVKGETLWQVGYALILLLVAWVALAKTDWCARAIADMSRSKMVATTSDDESDS